MSGAMALTGLPGQPFRSATSYVDYSTGISAAYGALAAILARYRTGRGQLVEASLLGTALAIMNPVLIEEASGARSRTATGNRSPISGPSDLFVTRDGWVFVQVIGQDMFERLARLVGAPGLIDDPRFADDIGRGEHGEVLSAVVAEWCAPRTSAECLAELAEARVPGCRLLSPAEALVEPQHAEGGHFDWVRPPGLSAAIPLVAPTARLTAGARPERRPAPALGADTDDIMKSLGYGDPEIADFRNSGVV
jgi:crotonobetainyl-CoA:carnitine CoA-transferase CaiB-like acyl-CoA transferase